MPFDKRHRGRGQRVLVVTGVILAVVMGAVGVLALRAADHEEIAYTPEVLEKEAEVLSDVVDVGGIACIPKRNIRSYLIMGIDDTATQGEDYALGGQCDVLILLVVDNTNKTYQYLPINRATLCDVRWYDVDGEDLGLSKIQIAFAHAVGDGGALSCENTVEAVSNYLGGVEIENYAALNTSAISTINRLVGGVTVTIEDDFSAVDPSLVQGETITLTDEQAEHFVRARYLMQDNTTTARMRRQLVFIEGVKARMLEKTNESMDYPKEVYDALLPDMVTNMNGKAFSRLINGLTDCEQLPALDIKGETGEDELGFEVFEPDEASVRDAVIEMYYRRTDEQITPERQTSE